jgi:hypothetical protein
MGEPLKKENISNFLKGQRVKFLNDSLSDNNNEYCQILKPRPFLILISHQ